MQITLSLAQCVTLYENHFKKEMPPKLAYKAAAQMVHADIGSDEFLFRLKRLDRDGTHKKQYTIYKDIEEAGESYTVYDNDLDVYVGQFLADDVDLKTYLAAGELRDGLDNRS